MTFKIGIAAQGESARSVESAAMGTLAVSDNIGCVTRAADEANSAATQVLLSAEELSTNSETLRGTVATSLNTIRSG